MDKTYIEVNYIMQINEFNEFAIDAELSANARLLYYALLHIWSRSGQGNKWLESIKPSMDRLQTATKLSANQINTARAELEREGALSYTPATGKQKGIYTLFILYLSRISVQKTVAQEAQQPVTVANIPSEGVVIYDAENANQDQPKTKSRPTQDQSQPKTPRNSISAHIGNNILNLPNETKQKQDPTPRWVPLADLKPDQQKAVDYFCKIYPAKSKKCAKTLYPTDVDLWELVKAVEDSPQFLAERDDFDIKWLLANHNKVLSGAYALRSYVSDVVLDVQKATDTANLWSGLSEVMK